MKALLSLFLFVQSYDIIELEKNLDILVDSLLASNAIPGLSLAVVDLRNENFITKGYGKRRVDQEDPVSEETLFCLASNSKLFTGVYSALIEKYTGISLDTRVNDIPELREDKDIFLILNSCSLSQEVTLRDFLSHRTGTKDDSPTLTLGCDIDTREIFASRSRYLEQISPFRSRYRYSNSGYTLAGFVAEKLCSTSSSCKSRFGTEWKDGIQEIFNMAQMNSSVVAQDLIRNFSFYDELTARSTLVDWQGNQHPNEIEVLSRSKAMEPSYGVISNSKDMARWIEFILGSPITANLRLDQDGIPCTGCRKYFSMGQESEPTDTEVVYALGTRTGTYRDYRKWVHSGAFGGYNSYLYMLPDIKIGVFTAVNGGGDTYGAMRKVIYHGLDTMLGLKPSLPDMQQVNSIDLENQKSQNNSIRLQAHPELKEPVLYQPKSLKPEFQNLIGSYYHPLLGEMIISIKNRRSCQTLEVYESLYVKIGKLGTGWIENLAFYDSGLINEKYMYPLSIDPTENEQCCVGIRCNEVQKIIPGVYPLVKDNDDLALDSWTDVDFIWNSSVWYVSDYSPVFSFEKNSSGEFTIVFRRGSWTSESYSFTRNHDNDFKWTDKCNLNSE